MNERSFCGIFRFFFFFFFFDIVFSHKQKFLGSKQAPRYTGKRYTDARTNEVGVYIGVKGLVILTHNLKKV